jgi:hypothetical protein
MGTSPVKAIPVVVDTFDVDHNVSTFSSNTAQVTGPTTTIIGQERDVFLEPAGTAQSLAGSNNANGLLLHQNFNFGSLGTSTLSLTYDGVDSGMNAANPTPGGGFDTTSGLGGIDVTGTGSVPNNVFTIEGFDSGGDIVDITIQLYDAHGVNRVVELLNFATSNPTDVTIALTEAVILGGVDTTDDNTAPDTSDNFFFESNSATTNFDYTQVTALKFETILDRGESYAAEGLRFERIPFEAESSIGIALLGAWGIWKRWKKQGEEMAEESNVSSS